MSKEYKDRWWKPLESEPITLTEEELKELKAPIRKKFKTEGRCPECGVDGVMTWGGLVCEKHGEF